MERIEFRLVTYMNSADSRNFWGGRGAASPLSYACQLQASKATNNSKASIAVGGSVLLQGFGRYRNAIENAIQDDQDDRLPVGRWITCDDAEITIGKKAYIYQNDDPLLSASESGIYWSATLDSIKCCNRHPADKEEAQLKAVKIGLEASKQWREERPEMREFTVFAKNLKKLKTPIIGDFDNLPPLMVYGSNGREKKLLSNGGPLGIPHRNAFVHMKPHQWDKYDEVTRQHKVDIGKLLDGQIKHSYICESLVHSMLKMLFAREGWWVNFELPVKIGKHETGRIDFLIKRDLDDDWRLVEVKLLDNPDAVQQLARYMNAIREDVRNAKDPGEDTYFWPLWAGRKKCRKLRGVVICRSGKDTLTEVKRARKDYDVWTYEYRLKNGRLGLIIRDSRHRKSNLILDSEKRC